MTVPEASSARAIAADAQGIDPTGLDRLFRSEAPHLLRYFRQKTGNGDAAADLVQDVFVRMLAAARVGEFANPAAYLQRIARNLLFDQSRRRQRSLPRIDLPLDDCHLPVAPRQEEEIEARDLLRCYEQAVAGLSDKTRRVFLLQRVEGLTYDAIRIRLGISMGTVEYHMMRAIAHIDRALEDQ